MTAKLTALQNLLDIEGGTAGELEKIWLIIQVPKYGTIKEMWMQVFESEHIKFDDAAYDFLYRLGYRGTLDHMWKMYWQCGGGVAVLPWWKRIWNWFRK